MTKEFVRYRRLERRLGITRWRHDGGESAEEDEILDEMDAAWMDLTESEQVCEPAAWAYEGFKSPLDAILVAETA